MSSQEPDYAKPGKSFDGAYGFSFTIAIALILFIAGLVVPLLKMRGQFTQNEVSGPCPYCGAGIKTSDTAIRLECPACNGLVAVRDLKLYAVES
jgi:predicted RNA-binding Zn-ribbon protein involved in translation (DUF1610 family)